MLAAIGISTENRRDVDWQRTYEQLKQFHGQYGHLRVPTDLRTPTGSLATTWIRGQMALRRAGRLDDAKIEMLDEIGFRWNSQEEDRQSQWETQLQELAAFQKTHGHINVPHGSLRFWFRRQAQLFDDGTLSSDRARKLAEIDPLWHDLHAALTSYRTRRNLSLTDPSWHDIRALLPVSEDPAWDAADQRAVIDAVLWKVRTRCDWNDIDLRDVTSTAVRRWYDQWRKAGVWDKIDDAARFRGAGQP
ncbi:Helicase associated domain protein [Paractinoplanes toevensis]|uniref:Helicase associated domain protein n=1 Tax=Paractinoplanes toevensis TaxID=571911 RepID=UPI001BB4250C|nr:Helicase associated domain protein [Actinoplanes toevensis]